MVSEDFLPFTRPSIDERTIAAVGEVLRSGWITSGPKVKEFEARLSGYFGGRPVRAVASATGAMELGLAMMGIGPGDEVITTPMTWTATAHVIVRAGAKPVFVDIDERTRNIDLTKVEAAITPATRALLPVDLAGLPVDRRQLYEIARRHNLRVLEDAAQSMGSSSHGERLGTSGDFASFSFHPNKNMTSIEGGCLVMNTTSEAQQCELWRLQGVERFADGTYDCTLPGAKLNLSDVAACVGLGQFEQLEGFNRRRAALARLYFEQFDHALGCQLPLEQFDGNNWHMFQIVLPANVRRDAFLGRMRELGIGVGVHYPALHLLSMYRHMGHKPGDFPVAERFGAGTCTLPLFPAMRDADVSRVCQAVATTVRELQASAGRAA